MSNVQVQISNQIQNSNIKVLDLGVDIHLTFEIQESLIQIFDS